MKTKEQPIFTAAVLSDIHIWCKYHFRSNKLKRALKDINRSKQPIDAFLSLGDITDHGEIEHWERIKECFRDVPLKAEIILALGNHDTWTAVPDALKGIKTEYEMSKEAYLKYRTEICGKDYKTPYFTEVINGITVISMATEASFVGAFITDEQLAWLDKELEKASRSRMPIFVLNHHAINKTHGLPKTFGDKEYTDMTGGIGEASDKVNDVLQKYDNVFFLTGHSHMGLCGKLTKHATFEKIGNIYGVNLPCYMFPNHDGLPFTGYGFILKVYSDRVEFKTRNFSRHFRLPLYDFTVPIKK